MFRRMIRGPLAGGWVLMLRWDESNYGGTTRCLLLGGIWHVYESDMEALNG